MDCLEGNLFKYPIDKFWAKIRSRDDSRTYKDIEKLRYIVSVFDCFLFSPAFFSIFWAYSKGLRPDIDLLNNVSIGTENFNNFQQQINYQCYYSLTFDPAKIYGRNLMLCGVEFANHAIFDRPKAEVLKIKGNDYGIINKEGFFCENAKLFEIMVYGDY